MVNRVVNMEQMQLRKVVEAALLAWGESLSVSQLREMFDEGERPEEAEVRAALAALAEDCAGRAVELVEVASGWRLQVRSEFALPVSRLWQERPGRYSRALLETLALIAYRQPITRGEIGRARGGESAYRAHAHRRGWIRVVGHREVPGRPGSSTTREFLDYFGLRGPTICRRSRRSGTRTTSACSGFRHGHAGPEPAAATAGDGESAG